MVSVDYRSRPLECHSLVVSVDVKKHVLLSSTYLVLYRSRPLESHSLVVSVDVKPHVPLT